MPKKIDLAEMFPPTRFIFIDDELYYDSPTRGKIRVIEVQLLPNYGDVELVLLFKGEDVEALTRQIGSKYGEEKIKDVNSVTLYHPLGDVVSFHLEDGRSIHMDLGCDPGYKLKRLVNEIMKRKLRSHGEP